MALNRTHAILGVSQRARDARPRADNPQNGDLGFLTVAAAVSIATSLVVRASAEAAAAPLIGKDVDREPDAIAAVGPEAHGETPTAIDAAPSPDAPPSEDADALTQALATPEPPSTPGGETPDAPATPQFAITAAALPSQGSGETLGAASPSAVSPGGLSIPGRHAPAGDMIHVAAIGESGGGDGVAAYAASIGRPIGPGAGVTASAERFEAPSGAAAAAFGNADPVSPSMADQITFISGVGNGAQLGDVASLSYWTWKSGTIPATYETTYSFAHKYGSNAAFTGGGTVDYWFDPAANWTATERSVFVEAMTLWSWVADIQFVEAASAGASELTFLRNDDGDAFESNNGVSTIGSATFVTPTSTFISIDTTGTSFGPIDGSFATNGGYAYETIVHEIGHALGLGHSGPYNGAANEATQQFSKYDMRLWTLMSYIDPTETAAKFYSQYPVTATNWGYSVDGYLRRPTTPMPLDIRAIQSLYGEPADDQTQLNGGDVFGFNSNLTGAAERFFDFTINQHPVITIWDRGVNNTLDVSGFFSDASINLAPGSFSSVNGQTNNIGIAFGTTIETAIGGQGDDEIVGTAGNNILRGNLGEDQLFGMDGVDQLYGGSSADRLKGGGGTDYLYGESNDDNLKGGGAADSLDGGQGIDTADYSESPEGVTVDLDAGGGVGQGGGGDAQGDILIAIENILGSNFLDTLEGSEEANRINGAGAGDFLLGRGGDDLLIGGAGADYLGGEGGNDTASYETAAAGLYASLNTPNQNTGDAAGDSYFQIENLTGSRYGDTLIGDAQANILDGGVGADLLSGGLGSDRYVVDNAGDIVVEGANAGVDEVRATVSFTLDVEIETLILLGASNIYGVGNALANVIRGNTGANVLDGGGGADTLIGGFGNDVYRLDNAGDTVTEAANAGIDEVQTTVSHSLSANVENLKLTGTSGIYGVGNALANSILGNGAANVLDGGGGSDLLAGGLGDDLYRVDSTADVVVENAGAGTDKVQATASHTLSANVENLQLMGTSGIYGVGNGLANLISGNAAANVLDGQAGADQLSGGLGNDLYRLDNAGDVVIETANAGVDEVQTTVSYTLGANVENLRLMGTSNLYGFGNALANGILGNSGANALNGGLGADTMAGGAGADRFDFTSALGGGNIDRITDFSVPDDIMLLENAVFVGLANGMLTASAFTTGAAATDTLDRIIYNSGAGALLFDRDGSGGAFGAVQFAIVSTGLALTAADFFVG